VFPEYPRRSKEITIPTTIAGARAVVYRSATEPSGGSPPVHVNFHGGGYVLAGAELDDPLCRYLAAEAGAVVINVEYVVAPQHPFPAAPLQAFEVVQWVKANGAANGWDGRRLTIGGQSAGGGLAAAVARLALERGGPAIALQVLHYPPLDLATPAADKTAAIPNPLLRPWMGEIFDSAYVPNKAERYDRLVSPANPRDTTDLTGIAPAVVITAAHDLLRAEGSRYAERLRAVGALREYYDVPQADHGYDQGDFDKARSVYALIAREIKRATA
jgi:acetyl esterase